MNYPKIANITGPAIATILMWLRRDFVRRKWDEFFATKEFYTLLETFFNEAAVLWFVFPLIDAIYKTKSSSADTSTPSLFTVVGTSWGAAAVFFYLAVNAKRNAERMK